MTNRTAHIGFALAAALVWTADMVRTDGAWFRGDVFYVETGTACPNGWINRSVDASLQAAYLQSSEMSDHDMCIGGA
jgi:hypothetical protein